MKALLLDLDGTLINSEKAFSNCFVGFNPSTKTIRIRTCEADQVYCDYEKGCTHTSVNGFLETKSGLCMILPQMDILERDFSEDHRPKHNTHHRSN